VSLIAGGMISAMAAVVVALLLARSRRRTAFRMRSEVQHSPRAATNEL
jgi:hypothetical protein